MDEKHQRSLLSSSSPASKAGGGSADWQKEMDGKWRK
jgi:hypothetical protein